MIVPRVMVYVLGGMAGLTLGAGIGLHLVTAMGVPAPIVFLMIAALIAAFVGLAHLLARTMAAEQVEPAPEPAVRPAQSCWGWLNPQGKNAQMGYPLNKRCMLIGRDVDNDIMINSSSISRTHAQLVRMEGAFLILDLDSKNGTYVNGEKVVQKQLHDGDSITVGEVHFLLRVNPEDVAAEAALTEPPA